MKGGQLEENIWSFKPITFKESVIFMIGDVRCCLRFLVSLTGALASQGQTTKAQINNLIGRVKKNKRVARASRT